VASPLEDSLSKKKQLPDQAERGKRSAAGSAHSTVGRSRVFKDRSVYNRTSNKVEMEMKSFQDRKIEILHGTPKEFHSALYNFAWREGHSCGESEVLIILKDLCEMIREPIKDYTMRITGHKTAL
jgi:hypothetical protein